MAGQQGDACGSRAPASRATRVGRSSRRCRRRGADHSASVVDGIVPPVASASSIALFQPARRRRPLARLRLSSSLLVRLGRAFAVRLHSARRTFPLLARLVPPSVVKGFANASHEALCSAPLVRLAQGCGRRVGRRRLRGADYSASRAAGDALSRRGPALALPCRVRSQARCARPFPARPPTTAGHEALYSAPLVRPARGRGRRLGRRRWRGADHSASLSCRRRSGAVAGEYESRRPSARSARRPVVAGHEALYSAPLVRPA